MSTSFIYVPNPEKALMFNFDFQRAKRAAIKTRSASPRGDPKGHGQSLRKAEVVRDTLQCVLRRVVEWYGEALEATPVIGAIKTMTVNFAKAYERRSG